MTWSKHEDHTGYVSWSYHYPPEMEFPPSVAVVCTANTKDTTTKPWSAAYWNGEADTAEFLGYFDDVEEAKTAALAMYFLHRNRTPGWQA